MKIIKVLSYNIHKGFTSRNRAFVLNRMREAIRDIDPDIVFLQEVVGHHISDKHLIEDWPSKSQFDYLAHELWEHYSYGKNAVYNKGHHGNALLSKYPIIMSENINISTNRFEQRGILHAVLDIPETNRKFHALCLHLNLLESGRKIQVQKICQRIEETVPHDEPLLIAGDFNDWKERVSHTLESNLEIREFYQEMHGEHARTFPSNSPFLRLDRIYYRGMNVKSAHRLFQSPWKDLSDHIALMGVFEIKKKFLTET